MTRGDRVIAFMETLRAPDGMLVGQPIKLRDWQKDAIRQVYDPVDERGKRLCRQAIFTLARKNGKTAVVAGLCLAHLCGPEAIRNGQLYSVAYDREQAGIIFKYMAAMVYQDEELSQRLNKAWSKFVVYRLRRAGPVRS